MFQLGKDQGQGLMYSLKQKLDDGEIPYSDVEQQYKSWRGYMEYFNSYKT